MPKGLFPCWGQRPWLGRDAQESCDQRLRLLVRSASNAYFAQVVSAISIPEPGRELEARAREVWNVLQAATPGTLPAFRLPTSRVRFYLLHSLAHLLISTVSLECGYAAFFQERP